MKPCSRAQSVLGARCSVSRNGTYRFRGDIDGADALIPGLAHVKRSSAYGDTDRVVELRGGARGVGVPLRSAAGKVAYLCGGGRSAYRNPADAMIAGIGNIERAGVCRRYPARSVEPCLRRARARRGCIAHSVCMYTDDVALYQCADSRGGCVDAAKGITGSIDDIERSTALYNEKRRSERCRGADAVCVDLWLNADD